MIHELPEIGIEHVSDALIAQVVKVKVNKKSQFIFPNTQLNFPPPPATEFLKNICPCKVDLVISYVH